MIYSHPEYAIAEDDTSSNIQDNPDVPGSIFDARKPHSVLIFLQTFPEILMSSTVSSHSVVVGGGGRYHQALTPKENQVDGLEDDITNTFINSTSIHQVTEKECDMTTDLQVCMDVVTLSSYP